MAEHVALAATEPPAPSPADAEVLFARQPILDVDGRLAGYELLYRGDGGSESPHAATSRVAASALSDLGLRQATGGAPAFINVTTEFLLAMDPLPFGPEGVVLEIAADRVPDARCWSAWAACASTATCWPWTATPASPGPTRWWTSPRSPRSRHAASGPRASRCSSRTSAGAASERSPTAWSPTATTIAARTPASSSSRATSSAA